MKFFTGNTGQRIIHDKAGDAFGAGVLICLYIKQAMIADRAVGNPHLIAVEQIIISLIFGQAFHACDIGADIRFCHRETADVFAADKFGNIVLFLFLGTKFLNGERWPPALHVKSHAPGSVDFGDLLDNQHAFKKAHAVATVFFINAEAKKSEFGHFIKNSLAPVLIFFVFLDMRFDFVFSKVFCHLLQYLLFFSQCKIHISIILPPFSLNLFSFHNHTDALAAAAADCFQAKLCITSDHFIYQRGQTHSAGSADGMTQ
ncbi:MAG: hypothetical protein BWY90_01310 [Deltaproteobacteria bacterium ADurb.BinA014]|nr:MAG: hypothetical protein BWY90_01310 [Deltaproteobacteria bacterium ADurb.BinA014]